MQFKKTNTVMFAMVLLWLSTTLCHAAPAPGQSPVGQFEVKVYTQRDFVGESKSYVLNIRTHRIGLVNHFPAGINDAVSSIHVGSQVYAILFDYHDFHVSLGGGGGNMFSGLVKILVDIHKKMTPLGYLPKQKPSQATSPPDNTLQGHINVGIYTASTPQVRHNNVYTSMLIIPRGLDYAYGVALYNAGDRFIRIEPIPDEKKFQERRVPDFGNYLNNKIGQVAFLGPRIKNTHISLYDNTHYQGKSITLPGDGSKVISFDLSRYDFSHKTESIRLWIDPQQTKGKRVAAPAAADTGHAQEVVMVTPIPTMKVMVEGRVLERARTPAKPHRPPEPAHARGDSPKAAGRGQEHDPDMPREPDAGKHHAEFPPNHMDLRGRWRDNQGLFFEILQHGPGFILLGDENPIHGAGIQLEPRRIELVMQSPRGDVLHLKGRLEGPETHGEATRILLENGVVLERD